MDCGKILVGIFASGFFRGAVIALQTCLAQPRRFICARLCFSILDFFCGSRRLFLGSLQRCQIGIEAQLIAETG